MLKKLVIVGEYDPAWETHRFTDAAIQHSRQALDVSLEVGWCSTEEIDQDVLETADGFWIATGAPYKSLQRALRVIRYAREHGVPCLGTCQGFQHIMLEYAQAHLGIDDPGHAEYNPDLKQPFIAALPCSLRGQEMEIDLAKDSFISGVYGATRVTEKYYCSYGVNRDFAPRIDESVLQIAGVDAEGEIRIVQYRQHPFLVGTLFVPQAESREDNPHPLVTAFMRSIFAM